jgi:hypothetical protein
METQTMSKIMNAYLIDPFTRTITEVNHNGDYREIYKLIGADCFDVVYLNRANDCCYIDDEGLYVEDQKFFLYHGFGQPLAGKGLVLGTNDEGDSVSPKITIEEVKKNVVWVDFMPQSMIDDLCKVTVTSW